MQKKKKEGGGGGINGFCLLFLFPLSAVLAGGHLLICPLLCVELNSDLHC